MEGNRKYVRSARLFGCGKRDLRPQLSSKEMDRYLLLVIWGEGKVPSAAGGEAESAAEGTEKLPGKRGTEKERERLAGRGRHWRSSFCKGGNCYLELSRASASLRRRPSKGWECRYLHGKHRDKFVNAEFQRSEVLGTVEL